MLANKAEASIYNLLQNLPPEVAEIVKQKYEDDRAAYLQVVAEMMPSKDPKYWAKRSCTRCHGRGILGTLINPSGTQIVVPPCSCTAKKYKAWLIDVRKFYNALKEQGHETTSTD